MDGVSMTAELETRRKIENLKQKVFRRAITKGKARTRELELPK